MDIYQEQEKYSVFNSLFYLINKSYKMNSIKTYHAQLKNG